ncbi:MAG: recombination protein RecR [Candidatus Nephthysia bennettiae]|uniref:Recombination protein RecR n=1 Tax=Candidatus Nephthysia bennettiae TaxID=3127016 RepID=A0A934NB37_9BACT|nr:recombination protein RecR [Candidatus Dormibacteraeota bacterium]MBJ7611668.1 recombination protein RecR [Candidatus Dormibacteraeota bacterium]PZR92360.1 MAG: recombination protein RecR [Candidatus Dormibacteraeota bacterium]
MDQLPPALEQLIQELSRLPSVGPKTAQRLAFHILRSDRSRTDALAQSILEVKTRIGYCERCYNIAEGRVCTICSSVRRDQSLVCVVESALDVLAIERTAEYQGLYHVLHGVISPIDGVGPEDIHVPQLVERLQEGGVGEVIVATDADIEGEATAVYLSRVLAPLGVRVTRPAHGLPVGGDLEYADELTLARAMSGRRAF